MGVFGLVMIDFKKALYPTLMFIFVRRASGNCSGHVSNRPSLPHPPHLRALSLSQF
jgi:hypothetical protein